jgi:demethylmenaquinone methyltransferase/2-methoxy-6-polyprenyl-1,4-benzoquinol methylase
MSEQVGDPGLVCLTDINASMLTEGRRKLLNRGVVGNVSMVQADAENLPFRKRGFHCVTIGFGLRNVTDKPAALHSMTEVLKPGGRLLVLEFSKPILDFLGPLYDFYSFNVLPVLGEIIAGDAESYQYLAESIRMHPDQEEMVDLMTEAGLEDSHYFNLTGGIVALHVGYKY